MIALVLGGFAGMPMRDRGWTQAGLPVEAEETSGHSYEALVAMSQREP